VTLRCGWVRPHGKTLDNHAAGEVVEVVTGVKVSAVE
jgi:hypothetical protein